MVISVPPSNSGALGGYLALLDCDMTEPANLRVVMGADLLLATLAALLSIFAPVCLEVFDWANAEPAKLFASLEAFGFRSVLDA